MERLVYIDILKGIAIIMVVMGHMFAPYTDYLQSPVNQMIYSVHMPLFIFLSGFVFHLSQGRKGIRITILKRTLSLLLPFICFPAIYCFAKNTSYIDMLFKNEMHNGYWFTLVLFEIILISIIAEYALTFIKSGGVKYGGDIILNTSIALALLFIAKTETIPDPFKTLFSTDKVAKFYLFFQMGKFVRTYSFMGNIFRKQWLYIACVISYFILFYKFGYDLQHVNIISFILPCCGIVILTNIVEKNQVTLNYRGILAKIGKNSLEIYLIHFLVLSSIPKEVIDCFGNIYLQVFVLFFLSITCIVISLLIAKVIHCSDFLDLFLLGKGNYLKKIISKIE